MLEIIYDVKLSERTTLRLGGKTIAEIRIKDDFDEHKLTANIKELGGDIFVLGAGSNILAADESHNIVLLKTDFTGGIEVLERDEHKTLISASANVRLPRLIGKCAKLGLKGLEGLSGIPGTVGGAVAMNAGSFGCEICSALHSVEVYSPLTGVITISAKDVQYSYRHFNIPKIKSWYFIIKATFILTQSTNSVIKEQLFLNFFKKKSTQPVSAWSAGCLFKNPSLENPAGKLLDQCGFKGKSRGGMIFSPIHANFLVNEGEGSASAAFELMEEAREAVQRRFGLNLSPEVKILCP